MPFGKWTGDYEDDTSDFQGRLSSIMGELEAKGYRVKSRGKRTAEEQRRLYQSGRFGDTGPIKTERSGEPGRESFHQLGTAADLDFFDEEGKLITSGEYPGFKEAGELGERWGLEWGGRWKKEGPNSVGPDPAHLQMVDIELAKRKRGNLGASSPTARVEQRVEQAKEEPRSLGSRIAESLSEPGSVPMSFMDAITPKRKRTQDIELPDENVRTFWEGTKGILGGRLSDINLPEERKPYGPEEAPAPKPFGPEEAPKFDLDPRYRDALPRTRRLGTLPDLDMPDRNTNDTRFDLNPPPMEFGASNKRGNINLPPQDHTQYPLPQPKLAALDDNLFRDPDRQIRESRDIQPIPGAKGSPRFWVVTNPRTGEKYNWLHDTPPTQEQAEDFIYEKLNQSWWQKFEAPLTERGSLAARALTSGEMKIDPRMPYAWALQGIQDASQPQGDETSNFTRGAFETAGDISSALTSPSSIASTAATLGTYGAVGAGLGATAKGFNWLERGLGAAQFGHGGYRAGRGLYEGDAGQVGAGALEMGFGALGMGSTIPKPRPDIPTTRLGPEIRDGLVPYRKVRDYPGEDIVEGEIIRPELPGWGGTYEPPGPPQLPPSRFGGGPPEPPTGPYYTGRHGAVGTDINKVETTFAPPDLPAPEAPPVVPPKRGGALRNPSTGLTRVSDSDLEFMARTGDRAAALEIRNRAKAAAAAKAEINAAGLVDEAPGATLEDIGADPKLTAKLRKSLGKAENTKTQSDDTVMFMAEQGDKDALREAYKRGLIKRSGWRSEKGSTNLDFLTGGMAGKAKRLGKRFLEDESGTMDFDEMRERFKRGIGNLGRAGKKGVAKFEPKAPRQLTPEAKKLLDDIKEFHGEQGLGKTGQMEQFAEDWKKMALEDKWGPKPEVRPFDKWDTDIHPESPFNKPASIQANIDKILPGGKLRIGGASEIETTTNPGRLRELIADREKTLQNLVDQENFEEAILAKDVVDKAKQRLEQLPKGKLLNKQNRFVDDIKYLRDQGVPERTLKNLTPEQAADLAKRHHGGGETGTVRMGLKKPDSKKRQLVRDMQRAQEEGDFIAERQIRRELDKLKSRGGPKPDDNPVVATFRKHLDEVDNFEDTRFILPDGTRVTHFSNIHEDAANELGMKISTALKNGVVRFTQGGIETHSKITSEQAAHLADAAYYNDYGKVYAEVHARNRRFNKAFDRGTSPETIRAWVNSRFVESGEKESAKQILKDSYGMLDEGLAQMEDAEAERVLAHLNNRDFTSNFQESTSLLAKLKAWNEKMGGEKGSTTLDFLTGGMFGGKGKGKTARQANTSGGPKPWRVNPAKGTIYEQDFAKWVNKKASAKVEAVLEAEKFESLKDLGKAGVKSYVDGSRTGKLGQVESFFNRKARQMADAKVSGKGARHLTEIFDNTPKEIEDAYKKMGRPTSYTFDTMMDEIRRGTDKGLTPKFESVPHMVEWYGEKVDRMIANKQARDLFKKKGWVQLKGGGGADWEDLPNTLFPTASVEGKPRGWVASPEFANLIKSHLGEEGAFPKFLGDIASTSKNLALSAGIPGTGINAHGANIMARSLIANLTSNPKRILTHGKYMLRPSTALEDLNKLKPRMSEAVQDGLTLTTEGYSFGAVGGSADLIHDIFGTKKGGLIDTAVTTTGKWFEDPLFQKAIPAIKMKHFIDMKDDLIKQGMAKANAGKQAADFTNELYGGINWQAMGRSKDMQNWGRAVILAPDWLETNMRLGKGVAQSLRNPTTPEGKKYHKLMASFGAAYLSATMINKATSGHFMHENAAGHTLDIEFGQAVGSDKTRWIRPFGTAADFIRLPMDAALAATGVSAGPKGGVDFGQTSEIIGNRLSIPGAAVKNLVGKRDRFGRPILGQDDYGRPIPGWDQITNAGLEASSLVTPPYVKGLVDLGRGKVGPEEAILGGFEIAPFRYSAKPKVETSGRSGRSGR